MFSEAYGAARMSNWPHRHRTPLPRIASPGLRRNNGWPLWGRQPFCPHFSSATEVCGWCDYTLPLFRIFGLGVILTARCLWSRPAWIVFFFLRCWVASGRHGRGMARSVIGCWVAAAMGRLSRSCDISILRRIVSATKTGLGPILLLFSV